ncbi:MAG: CapA family protein [Chloroflexi bacterium]|nr:CapA family protein [Chloroflexota bacterium]
MKKNLLTIIFCILLAACAPATDLPAAVATEPAPTATLSNTPMPEALWIGPAVPADLLIAAKTWNIPVTDDPSLATQQLNVADSGSVWIYALVAPFPTVTDDVSFADLSSAWKGVQAGPFAGHALLMAQSTLEAFTALWGEPASGAVRVVPSDELVDTAWAEMPAWAIIPFEEIQPKWKVLSVDGQSPIHKNFNADVYPLKVTFGLTHPGAFVLPESNRDPSKLATVVLTGVTALVRAIAATMEVKGVTYPGSLIGDWLREADVAHVSNEVPFDAACPTPNYSYTNLVLCSDPKYMELFLNVGTDVIELTGDHFADRGVNAMLDTLALYKANNLPYYGGGANETEARKPLLMTVNGNKIAFMGCNGKIKYPKATDTIPGAARCDYDFFVQQVKDVRAQGYMVIFTFQHEECYFAGPCYTHTEGFHKVADAGATIVSGSQAHFPHIMEFRGDSFIHYGLGNLFFDQMKYILPDGTSIDGTRREFLDRHVFYNGHYLGVELLTAMLEDYSRPRPMTEVERTEFLSEYFNLSGWTPLSPTPIPQPTVTLTPIALP